MFVLTHPLGMAVRREIPLPPEEALQGFIPSSAFPSDHLAVRPFTASIQLSLGDMHACMRS